MIELVQVTKRYGDLLAVNALDLQVREGEIIGIVGHNGAGKTSTLKMIAGLIAPTSGAVRVLGCDMAKESTAAKRDMGYLPEENPLYENMTAHEYLTFLSELYGLPKTKTPARIDELLGSLNLREKDELTGECSKGMKCKVAIARALLHDPRLLILDEPNAGLDPLTSFFIIDYLKTLKSQGKTIVLSVHNLFHVEYICHRVAIIKNGRLIVCNTMDAIRASLGNREYQVIFRADAPLKVDRRDGNYVFRSSDVGAMALVLGQISENNCALVDLSVQESALEEIYVRLMTNDQV